MTAMADDPTQAEAYIQSIVSHPEFSDERRGIMLILLILDNGGADVLRKRVKEKRQVR